MHNNTQHEQPASWHLFCSKKASGLLRPVCLVLGITMKIKVKFILIFWFASIQANAQSVQQSHIDSNLPKTYEEFIRIFERDVTSYFSQEGENDITVEYELLRKQPTQSGVSYPKFYAWIKVYNKEKTITQGAIRFAAIDKVRVEITSYITSNEIQSNPAVLDAVFPKLLNENIRQRAGIRD